ncbi:MAG: hypothetical protein WC587_02515 [Candidatus Paceibacterota bacterium]
MFTKKNYPKIYCKITTHNESNTASVDFYGLLAFKTVNKFLEIKKEKGHKSASGYIDLSNMDFVYHFLANENFIPVSEKFFYREMERRDQLTES